MTERKRPDYLRFAKICLGVGMPGTILVFACLFYTFYDMAHGMDNPFDIALLGAVALTMPCCVFALIFYCLHRHYRGKPWYWEKHLSEMEMDIIQHMTDEEYGKYKGSMWLPGLLAGAFGGILVVMVFNGVNYFIIFGVLIAAIVLIPRRNVDRLLYESEYGRKIGYGGLSRVSRSEADGMTISWTIEETPAIRTVNEIIIGAIHQSAPAIYFTQTGNGLEVAYRINDTMVKQALLSEPLSVQILSRLEVMAELKYYAKQRQQGTIGLNMSGREYTMTLTTEPGPSGKNAMLVIDNIKELTGKDLGV